MRKSQPKHPSPRATKENIGCMNGLFNIFHGSNSRKFLTDRPHRSPLSFRAWYSKKKNKLKLLTNSEEKHERSNHDGQLEEERRLSSSSFNKTLVGIVTRNEQHDGQLEEERRLSSSSFNKTSVGRVPQVHNLVDARNEQHDGQLEEERRLSSSSSNKTLVGRLPQVHHLVDARNEQVQLPKDDHVLQETLDEVLENLLPDSLADSCEASSTVVAQRSEELEKVLKTLKTNKELLLKVLQDPKILNVLMAKHIQGLQVVPGTSSDKQHAEEAQILEEQELTESKCGKERDASQKLSRIVVLKPNPVKNQCSLDVNDPGSPSQSSQSSSQSMEEFLPFHFLIQEIKKRLKQAFGVNHKNQQLTTTEVIYGSKASVDTPKIIEGNLNASQPLGGKDEMREAQACTESEAVSYGIEKGKHRNRKRPSRKLEDLLDMTELKKFTSEVSDGRDEKTVVPHRQGSDSPVHSPRREEIIVDQLAQSEKKIESLTRATDELPAELKMPDVKPDILSSQAELSSPEDFKIVNSSDTKADSCAAGEDSSEVKPISGISSVSGVPVVSPESNKKPEKLSPVSVLDSFVLDKITRPRSIKADRGDDEYRISPRKLHFEEHNVFKVVNASPNSDTKLQTCAGDDRFKFKYMRDLLEASGLCDSDVSMRDTSNQLLDPSLYDEIETPEAEIPDDLRPLFDSINEVLEEIYDRSSSCTPWASFITANIHPFPTGERLIQEAQRGLNVHFVPWIPITLEGVVKKDLDIRMWMDIRPGMEEISFVMGDDIFDEILEETIFELRN